MLSDVVEAYRRTKKPRDILWNRFVARPLAAVLLVPLARTRVTPNQVTLLTLVVFAAGAAMLAVCPARGALIGSVAILELSYVLDCVDGQLARMKGTSSPVGARLDFLMDEIKAFVLVAAVAIRLWRGTGGDRWLLEGLLGLVAVATAISLTTFVRRPSTRPRRARPSSTAPATTARASTPRRPSPRARPSRSSFGWAPSSPTIRATFSSWPSPIASDLFLHVYAGLHAAHAARSLLGVALRLGRGAPRSGT